jgi:D-3-phosphoglycerate dehydrogenase / 2-oxoglutarate reductase
LEGKGIEYCINPLNKKLTEDEPYSGKLAKHDNCILTGYMGSMSVDCRTRMEIEATEEAIRFLIKKPLEGVVPEEEYEVQRAGL